MMVITKIHADVDVKHHSTQVRATASVAKSEIDCNVILLLHSSVYEIRCGDAVAEENEPYPEDSKRSQL